MGQILNEILALRVQSNILELLSKSVSLEYITAVTSSEQLATAADPPNELIKK